MVRLKFWSFRECGVTLLLQLLLSPFLMEVHWIYDVEKVWGLLGIIIELLTNYFSYSYSFIIFCLLFKLEINKWQKRNKDTFKLNFFPRFTTILWRGDMFFLSQYITVHSVKVCKGTEKDFVFGTRKPIFSGMCRLHFLSETSRRLLFLYLFIDIFFYYCFFYFFFNPHKC